MAQPFKSNTSFREHMPPSGAAMENRLAALEGAFNSLISQLRQQAVDLERSSAGSANTVVTNVLSGGGSGSGSGGTTSSPVFPGRAGSQSITGGSTPFITFMVDGIPTTLDVPYNLLVWALGDNGEGLFFPQVNESESYSNGFQISDVLFDADVFYAAIPKT